MAFVTPPQDRRLEARRAVNARGIVVAPGLEIGCTLVDSSAQGMRIRLDRQMALPRNIVVVDVAAGTACTADVAWARGHEAGLKCQASSSLRGLTPARLAPARDAWLRAGGR